MHAAWSVDGLSDGVQSSPFFAVPVCDADGISANQSVWYGFTFDSMLGYPGEGPPGNLIDGAEDEEWSDEMLEYFAAADAELQKIQALPIVVGAVQFHFSDMSANLNKVIATVSCCWQPSRASFKQVAVCCDNTGSKPSHLEALRALHAKLVAEHACDGHMHHPLAVARRSVTMGSGPPEEQSSDAFSRMRLGSARLQAAQRQVHASEACLKDLRAKEAALALEIGVAVAANQSSAAALQAMMPQRANKKQKAGVTESSGGDTRFSLLEHDDDRHLWQQWSVSKWQELETKTLKRRSTPIDPTNTAESYPPRGDDSRGWRHHWRRGLHGAVRDWAEGSRFCVAYMLATLVKDFDVESEVIARLGRASSDDEQAQTDAYIVERIRAALCALKSCVSEQQREEFHIVLAACAPVREDEGDRHGMIRRVSERIGVQRGSKYIKEGHRRPRAFERAIERRQEMDLRAGLVQLGTVGPSLSQRPYEVGEEGMSRGRPCKIIAVDHASGCCQLEFEVGGVKAVRDYTSLGKARGGARLSRPPLSLRPHSRSTRVDEKAEKVRKQVEEFFDEHGARSPAIRDEVRRRLGVHVYERAQALIVYATSAALYATFLLSYPMVRISFTLFKALRPWYVRRAKREVCLCKHCENFKGYKDVLRSLPKVSTEVQLCCPIMAC